MSSHKSQILSGFIYTFFERVGAQGISFVVSIILARILLPEEYGVIAVALIFVTLCDVIVTYGFGNSLVVNQKSDNIDFSTCFYFSIAFSLIVYSIIWITSPFIADYFGFPVLKPLLRFLGLRLPIVAIYSVQQSYVSKHMLFKMFFYGTLVGTLLSGVISITMAYWGFGIWALAAQSFSNIFFNTLTLWLMVKWRPIWAFSWQRLKVIYDYGWKILFVGLVDKLYSQIRDIVIAKKYSAPELAYYNRGMQFPQLGMNILEPTLANVLFPALSKCNDNPEQMKSVLRRTIKLSTYVITPFFIGLICIAKPLIMVLLTEKWADSVIFLQLGCLAFLFSPLQIINSTMIRASGNSGLLLKLDVIKKSIGIILLIISVRYGIIAIVSSLIVTNIISTFINILPNRKVYKYGYRDQFLDIIPNLLVSVGMAIPVMTIACLPIGYALMLTLQIITGIVSFLLLSKAFRLECFSYIISNIKTKQIF